MQPAAQAKPFPLPLRTAVSYVAGRWADEKAARSVGSRKAVARAIGKAALVARSMPGPTLAALAARGLSPAAPLAPPPPAHAWPPMFTPAWAWRPGKFI